MGVALPCVVPKEWVAPPDYEDAGGELLNDEEEEERREDHERTRMLRRTGEGDGERRVIRHEQAGFVDEEDIFADNGAWDSEEERRLGGSGKGKKAVRDSSGRVVPTAERAPIILR